jgi:hypothetical protein
VRKTLVVAVCSTFLGIAIVVGCGAPSPDGDIDSPTRNPSNKDDASTSSALDGSSSTGDPSCASHAKIDDRPACDQCARAHCCKYVLDCDESPDCQALMQCFDDCAGDAFCQFTCSAAHEPGSAVLTNVSSCAKTKCGKECPDVELDGGLDFDAF